jgi:PAS domain S-box-containing protein
MNDQEKIESGKFLTREEQGRKTVILVRWILIIVVGYLVVFSNPNPPLLFLGYLLWILFALSNLLLTFSPKRWFEKDVFIFSVLLVDVGMASSVIYITARMDSEFYLIYFLILFISAFTQKTKYIYFSTGLLIVSYGISSFLRYPQFFSDPSFLLRFPFIFVVSFFFSLMIESYNRVRQEKELLKEDYRELEVLTDLAQSIAQNKNPTDFQFKLVKTLGDKLSVKRCMSILVDKMEKQARIVSSDDPLEKAPLIIDLKRYPSLIESLHKDTGEIMEHMLPDDRTVSRYILKELPLLYQGEKLGFLYLRVNTPHLKLTHREEYFLSCLSQITAAAIYNLEKDSMNEQDEILIVDDTPITQNLLREILTAEGFQVRSANNGELALDLIAANPPQLILLDINMPGMDGFEVCRRLKSKEESAGIPVIFISGLTNLEEKVIGFGLGAVDFITKPFQRKELLARIRTQLDLNKLRTKLETQVAERTAELRKSEEKYRTILETIEDPYYEVDLTGKFSFINDAMVRTSGHSKPELLEMNFREYTDMATGRKLKEIYEQVYRTGEPCKGIEHEVIIKDGTKKNMETSISLIKDSSGNPIGFRGITRDITQLRRMEKELLNSEERFRVVAECSNDFIFEWDFKSGQVDWFGDPVERFSTFLGELPVTATSFERIIHPEDSDRISAAFNRHLERGDLYREEYRMIGKNGNIVHVRGVGTALRTETGKPYKWVGAISNITDRKKAEEGLKTLSKR